MNNTHPRKQARNTQRSERKAATTLRNKGNLRSGGVILSLCGVLACNYFGLGLGRVVCHGLMLASLGSPARTAFSGRTEMS